MLCGDLVKTVQYSKTVRLVCCAHHGNKTERCNDVDSVPISKWEIQCSLITFSRTVMSKTLILSVSSNPPIVWPVIKLSEIGLKKSDEVRAKHVCQKLNKSEILLI